MTGRDAVCLRPLMYFGTLDTNVLYQFICHVLDHALDEAANGTCDRIEIVLHDGNTVSVRDNGLGIPIDTDAETGQPLYQFSPMEKPGKLNKSPQGSIQALSYSLGLAPINAVSSSFSVVVKRDGFVWQQQFVEGQPLTSFERVRPLLSDETTGTEIAFTPDYSIFHAGDFDHGRLVRRLHELAYLVRGLTIVWEDRRSNANNRFFEFASNNGISDFVRHLNRGYTVFHEPITIRKTLELERHYEPLGVSASFDIAFQYADVHQPIILSFMNGFEVEYGGPHIKGMMDALASTITRSAAESERNGDSGFYGFTEDDCTCGLTAVLSMRHPQPETCNSIYYILANSELENAVSRLVRNAINEFSETNPDQMQRLVEHCLANKSQRLHRRDWE